MSGAGAGEEGMGKSPDELVAAVSPERLQAAILDLVRIPSPSGSEREAGLRYAELLREAGAEVELDEEFPESPSVIGRVKGSGTAGTLQFDGHTDTIDVPGPDVRVEGSTIYGRGTEDMKGDLAAVAESLRVLVESGVELPGDILVTAHGRHESGTNETLEGLLKRGIHGDAVVVCEGPGTSLPVVGLGLGIWELTITREGQPIHENQVPPGTPHPLDAGLRVMEKLRERAAELATTDLDYLGPESVFVGLFRCGDYFNRLPVSCRIAGSRRFGPARTLADVRREFERIASDVAAETDTKISLTLSGLESFEVGKEEAIVRAVREAHRRQTGVELPWSGMRTVGNVSNFVRSGGLPAVYYGIGLRTAHSDNEHIDLQEAVQMARVLIRICWSYFGLQDDGGSAQEAET